MPSNSTMQPINQINQQPELKPTQPYPKKTQTIHKHPQNWETKKRFDVNCQHSQHYAHKWAECGKRLHEKASAADNRTQPRQTGDSSYNKSKCNPRDVCQICGQIGHSAWDRRYRIPGQSAYRKVPYNKQTTSENKEFRRDFRRAQNQPRQMNEINMEPQISSKERRTEWLLWCYRRKGRRRPFKKLRKATSSYYSNQQCAQSYYQHYRLLLKKLFRMSAASLENDYYFVLCEENVGWQLPHTSREQHWQARPKRNNSNQERWRNNQINPTQPHEDYYPWSLRYTCRYELAGSC